MLNYSFVDNNESKSDNLKMDNSSSLETVVVINCILNAPLMLTSITGNALVLATMLRTPSFSGVSLATITAISVDRLLALHYHLTYPNLMTTNRALYASASLWFVSILLPYLTVWKWRVFNLFVGVYITICFVLSSASYIKIYFIVRHHQIQIHAHQQAVDSFNISVNIPDSNNVIISKKRALKTFIYFICMIFCYLPYLSYSLLHATSVLGLEENWSFAETVVFLNSSVNPFLYCWCNREIRTSAVKLVLKMMCKQTEVASELEV